MMNAERAPARQELPRVEPPRQERKKRVPFSGLQELVRKESQKLKKEQRPTKAEIERRGDIEQTVKNASLLDQEFFKNIAKSGESIAESGARLECAETLALGAEDASKREAVGEAGVNSISRRTYEGAQDRVAYVKQQSGEAAFRLDGGNRRLMQIMHVLDDNGNQKPVEQAYAEYQETGYEQLTKDQLDSLPFILKQD